MKLSIIIPVYNVENYIKKCLASCLYQQVSFSEYEIIVVNDGSLDNSLQIIQDIALMYPNICVVSQENRGLSAARNKGLSLAKGEYVWFVDSDDTITEGALEAILKGLNSNVDILGVQYRLVYDDASMNRDVKGVNIDGIKDGRYVIVHGGYSIPVPFSIYKRQFLIDKQLHFAEGKLHEDSEFKPRAIYLADKIKSIDYICYNYYKGNVESIMSNYTVRNVEGCIYAAESLMSFSRTVDHICKRAFYIEISGCIQHAMYLYTLLNNIKDKQDAKRIILRNKRIFYSMIKTRTIKYMIEGILLIFSPNFFLHTYQEIWLRRISKV